MMHNLRSFFDWKAQPDVQDIAERIKQNNPMLLDSWCILNPQGFKRPDDMQRFDTIHSQRLMPDLHHYLDAPPLDAERFVDLIGHGPGDSNGGLSLIPGLQANPEGGGLQIFGPDLRHTKKKASHVSQLRLLLKSPFFCHACPQRQRTFLIILMLFCLSSCGPLHQINHSLRPVPSLNRIQNPTAHRNHVPVTMPCPQPMALSPSAKNSLWSPEASSFLKDQRAKRVGDILTVSIEVHDKQFFSETRKLETLPSTPLKIGAAFGLKAFLQDKLEKRAIRQGADRSPVDLEEGLLLRQNNKSDSSGRQEYEHKLNTSVPVTVIQILKNGNLVIQGSQQMRLGREMRSILISGIIRPSDIDSDNSITWDKVAESRLSIGSRGYLTDGQNPTWISEVMSQLPL